MILTVFPIRTGWNHLVPIGNWLEIILSGPIGFDLSDWNLVGQIGQISYYLGGTVFQNFQSESKRFRLILLRKHGAQTRPPLFSK